MRKTILFPDKETQHLHEIAAEAAAKSHLSGGKQSDFPKYLRAALQSKDLEAPFLAEKNIKAIAEEVANEFTRNGYRTAKDIALVCTLFDKEFEQVQYWTGRAREIGEKIPSTWLELIHMCNQVFDRN